MRTNSARLRAAFTLIELLVVIVVIGILAALIAGTVGIVNTKKIQSQARGALSAVELAVNAYKGQAGFYPPDNPLSARVNPLAYELRGVSYDAGNGWFNNQWNADRITTGTLGAIFNVSGLVNSTNAKNFLAGWRNSDVKNINTAAAPAWVLTVPSRGPADLPAVNSPDVNTICYTSSHPTNNQASFDLWVDVMIGGKTNRISNWSKEPQAL